MSFETELVKLDKQIKDLKATLQDDSSVMPKITALEEDLNKKIRQLYSNLSPIQKVEISRHPNRPHGLDYIKGLCDDFFELCGDRCFGEDKALVTGIGTFRKHKVMIIAHEKGYDSESRKLHNFGMPMPEGYRKARRVMQIAAEMMLPILCLIDTPGAYPGITSEERGQGHALAECLAAAIEVKVPIISCLIGEGGSGGAVAIGVANKVIMLEHSVYSVISPEGCASILWKTKDKKADAAIAQKLTAQDLYKYGVVDVIVDEPFGGAHRRPDEAISLVADVLDSHLNVYANKNLYYFYLQERIYKFQNTPRERSV